MTMQDQTDFHLVEKRLADAGCGRYLWEPISSWLHRIEETLPEDIDIQSLNDLVVFYYRYRFDPESGKEQIKTELQAHIHSWLENNEITLRGEEGFRI